MLLMMPRRGFNPRAFGVVLAAATLGGLWLHLGRRLPEAIGLDKAAMGYYYVFSAIAIFAAARLITHKKPVFSALWFLVVALASAGMLVLLSAEFMAAAVVIIYGGGILVTYVFVLMLAAPDAMSQANREDDYNRTAREPLMAVIVGYILLATLLTVFFQPMTRNYAAADPADAVVIRQTLSDRPAQRLAQRLQEAEQPMPADLEAEMQNLDDVERVGLDLFRSHPLGIELAGVILLVALIGAVVISRQVPPEVGAPEVDSPEARTD